MTVPAPRLSQLQRMIAAYRNAILTLDDAALLRLQNAYAPSRERLLSVIEALTGQISAGGKLTTTEAMELGRARELLRLIEVESGKLARLTGEMVPSSQAQAIAQALERARMLSIAQGRDVRSAARVAARWTALNDRAVADLMGALSDGSPLSAWIERVVPDSVTTMRETLLDGVTRGINPEDLARRLAAATDLPLQRAMTLSRTEVLRSYRSATLASYAEQADILSGWQWSCAPSGACVACIAKDGDVYPLTTMYFPAHPRCRCTALPVLKDDSLLPQIETAGDRFRSLPMDEQLKQIPMGARAEYQAGRLTLDDFVHERHDEEWGTSVQVASIAQARRNARSRRSGGDRIAAGG